MRINKRALLVMGIIIYEIVLNYILYPLNILGLTAAPVGVKIFLNTMIFGLLVTFLTIVIGVSIFMGIYYLIKWINEDTKEKTK